MIQEWRPNLCKGIWLIVSRFNPRFDFHSHPFNSFIKITLTCKQLTVYATRILTRVQSCLRITVHNYNLFSIQCVPFVLYIVKVFHIFSLLVSSCFHVLFLPISLFHLFLFSFLLFCCTIYISYIILFLHFLISFSSPFSISFISPKHFFYICMNMQRKYNNVLKHIMFYNN